MKTIKCKNCGEILQGQISEERIKLATTLNYDFEYDALADFHNPEYYEENFNYCQYCGSEHLQEI